MLSDLFILLPAAIVLLGLLVWDRPNAKPKQRPRRRTQPKLRSRKAGQRRQVKSNASGVPKNAIVLDGSNVMHWGGDPSLKVLKRVIIRIEEKGFSPIIFFDANVGYKFSDHYYDEAKLARLLGIAQRRICVVGKGIVADECILDFATLHRLRVVSNDRFRDWRVQFPAITKKGALVRGDWREGDVSFGNRLAARVAA